MLIRNAIPEKPEGLWILEGTCLAGKTTLLRRWRSESSAPLLWSAEDLATQRLFEPLEVHHKPDAVEPWLESMLEAWEALQKMASATPWSPVRSRFTAHQERFHLSARFEHGIGAAHFESLETRLLSLKAEGVLVMLSAQVFSDRLNQSLDERPPSWAKWLEHRFGSIRSAETAFWQQQARLQDLAIESRLTWHYRVL
jgi:hypothetical protein